MIRPLVRGLAGVPRFAQGVNDLIQGHGSSRRADPWRDCVRRRLPCRDQLHGWHHPGLLVLVCLSSGLPDWPPGKAIAIFFGPTPMSTGTDPVPASEVNIVGRLIDDATLLREVKNAQEVRISIEQ